MLINDVKKGAPIRMTGGRVGKMMDNLKGNIRMVEVTNGVNGPEIGSIYAKDILEVRISNATLATVTWEKVELSENQKKAAKKISAFGFRA